MARVLIPVADGSEEMEAVILTDVLRRSGWDVNLAAVQPLAADGRTVVCSRQVALRADMPWESVDIESYDALVVPGGTAGAERLKTFAPLLRAIRRLAETRKLLAAICAGPLVLQAADALKGRQVTCYPALRTALTGCTFKDEPVVVDGRLITSQGPGTTFAFAFAIIRALEGFSLAKQVARGLLLDEMVTGG